MMKEHFKKEYDAPMVELIEARVEKGFQSSGSIAPEPQTAGSTEGLTEGGSYTGNDFD
ncbi:MAG: hypothetical protein IJK84_05000 [Bacteroidales bacterium]|nr:hypothetical protein [Bacteroidales bacterium]MBR3412317.1 hypothetical protein [Bacteroidales bacterium]